MNHPLDIIGGTIGVIHSFCFRSVPITSGRALLPFCRYINQIDYSGIIGADALAVQWTAKEKRRSLFWEASPLSHLTIFIVRRACCPHLHQTLDRCVSIHPIAAHLTRACVKRSNNPRDVSDNVHYGNHPA
jgi:hypothetical protein